MQYAIDTEKMLREGWLTPTQVGEIYSGVMDALHAQTGVFEALGNTTLAFGFAVLLSIPAMWAISRKRS